MRKCTVQNTGLPAHGLTSRLAPGFVVAAALVLLAQPVLAQMGTGRVSGTVKDPTGNPIEGANVTAQAGDSSRILEATTDDRGRWAILGFRSRAYDFSVQAPGYMPYNYQAPMKQAGKNPDMDLVLEPAQMGQSAGTGGGLLAEAQELHQAGRFEEALVRYDEVLMQDPTMYQVHLNRGAALRELDRPDEARAAYELVLVQEAENAGAHVSLAEMAVAVGDLETAVTHFEAAVGATDDEVIPFNVGQIYFNNGEMDKAIEFYAEAADRRLDWAEPHLQIAMVHLNQGNMDSAAEHLQMAIEVEPDSPAAAQAQAMLDALPKSE